MHGTFFGMQNGSRKLGTHVGHLEFEELSALRQSIAETGIAAKIELIHQRFDVRSDCPVEELQRAARTPVALGRFASVHVCMKVNRSPD